MSNKLVQQQLKNIIRSLSDQELEKVLSSFEAISNSQVEKSCRMISYKWYEKYFLPYLLATKPQ